MSSGSRRSFPGQRRSGRREGVAQEKDLSRLREHSVEGIILDLWLREWKLRNPELLHLLRAVAAHGVGGGLAYTLKARDSRGTALSERTIRRRLDRAGLSAVGDLLRDARLRSVRLRTQLGASRADAVRAAGFSSVKTFQNAVRRSG